VVNLAALLLGPLAGPECRRALARGWLILVRTLAAAAVTGVVLVTLWWWWLGQKIEHDHRPLAELRVGLTAVEGMLVTLALVLAPAVLAGSLAGERERGALGLLLTTRVSPREVVSGRMAGKLSQVGMILLAGVPALIALTSLAGVGPGQTLAYLALPAAVGLGGAGIAAVASTLSRRGRDALLSVYLLDLALLLAPLTAGLGLSGFALDAASALNPYQGLGPLVFAGEAATAWASAGVWAAVGVAGGAVASWRLRPSCLAPLDGERVTRSRGRRGFVPPVDERRPMLWKELFVERVGTLGRFGRWAGLALVIGLGGGSLGLTAAVVWERHHGRDAAWATDLLAAWVGASGWFLGALIQWAVGLRAAVSISSERERGTWDALMTSPLDARAIVWGKLWGSLLALRGLLAAALLAWLLAAAVDAVRPRDAARWACDLAFIGAFMAAVGVRTSLACQTATRAMSLTIGAWLAAYVVVVCSAGVLLAVGTLLANAAWIALAQAGLAAPVTYFWLPLASYLAWPLATNGVYLLLTLLIVTDTRLRFDRLAGRMTEGRVAVAFEDLVYGRPEAPELLEPEPGEETAAPASPREDAVAGPA